MNYIVRTVFHINNATVSLHIKIIDHHDHSGMQILSKSICNMYVTDRMAT